MQVLFQHLPEQYKQREHELVEVEKTFSNTIQCVLDSAETASRGVNTSVLIRPLAAPSQDLDQTSRCTT